MAALSLTVARRDTALHITTSQNHEFSPRLQVLASVGRLLALSAVLEKKMIVGNGNGIHLKVRASLS